jgi:protein phosphatase
MFGPSGAGKTTLARQILEENGFPPTAAVSNDFCRLMLVDDLRLIRPEMMETLERDRNALFASLISMRMRMGRPTVADRASIRASARAELLELAREHGYATVLVALDLPLDVCLAQNAGRERGLRVSEQEVRMQKPRFDQALPERWPSRGITLWCCHPNGEHLP